MPMTSPVDATTTAAWAALTELKQSFQPDLRQWFEDDPARAERLSFAAGDLFVDLSKNLVDGDVLEQLLALAEQVRLPERRGAVVSRWGTNLSEERGRADDPP